MPKVYLPLGSAAASGQFGEMMVFQGTNVRSYVVPVDPRSDAQLDVRHLFYDVTKIMRTLGLLGKGLLAAYIGPRWYTDSYKRVSENAAARLIAEGVNWDAFTEPQKEEWRNAAPFVATYNDPGEMYFCIARILNEWIEPITGADFLSVYPNPTTAAAYRVAWDVGLDDVVTLSKTNDDDDRVVYSGTWSVQSDSSAFGGNYHKTSTPNSQCFFYFTGNQISLGFVGLTNGGTLQAEFSDGEAIQIDQYRAVATYGLAAVKNFLTAGVHWVRLGFFGSGTQVVNLDSIDCAKIKGALPAVPGNEISHSALEDLGNDDHLQYHNDVRGDARYLRDLDGIISNQKRANMAQATISGRAVDTGTGAPQDLTSDQVAAIVATQASSDSGAASKLLKTNSVGLLQTEYFYASNTEDAYSSNGGSLGTLGGLGVGKNIVLGGKLGITINPYYAFDAQQPAGADRYLLRFGITGVTNGFTVSYAHVGALISAYLEGELVVGVPTGGAKGYGTISAQAVYDDNVLLTDFVFEPEYKMLSIGEMTEYYMKYLHLPTIPGREEWDKSGSFSLGEIVTRLWETIEVQARYISELDGRLKKVE